jgi:hypothetical protein
VPVSFNCTKPENPDIRERKSPFHATAQTNAMLFFSMRAAPSRVGTPPPDLAPPETLSETSTDSNFSKSSRELLDTPPHTQSVSPSPLTRPSSDTLLGDCSSWDSTIFGEQSNLLPPDRNGDRKTDFAEAVKHPIASARAAKEVLELRQISSDIAKAAEAASESVQDKLTHALDGLDLPAMHDKVFGMIPSVSMPTMRQFSRSIDAFSDSVMGLPGRGRDLPELPFLEEELAGDQFAFARDMGFEARIALIGNGICRPWQIQRMGSSLHWQQQMDDALVRLFIAEKKSFTVEQFFAMKPVWIADVAGKVWRLELDTGFTEVIVDADSDDFEEKSVTLDTGFVLSERCGCVSVADVERGAVLDMEQDWLAVKDTCLG